MYYEAQILKINEVLVLYPYLNQYFQMHIKEAFPEILKTK